MGGKLCMSHIRLQSDNMKFFILLLAVAGASCYSLYEYREGQRFFYYPDGEGQLRYVDAQEVETEKNFDPVKDMEFNLFTRLSPTVPAKLIPGDANSLTASKLDKKKAVKVVIHGWISDLDSEINEIITKAYLDKMDVNVIVVNWEKGAKVVYGSAVSNVPLVAARLAALIDWLVRSGVPLASFHSIGHSLGAHIAGISARSITSGKFPYVTALDPAAPFWGSGSGRVTATDAAYVEMIHTNTASLGLTENLGHNDFYPNGGTDQPGCLVNSCSHARSYKFFAASIDNRNFMGVECLTLKEAQREKCTGAVKLHMGGSTPKTAIGIFHLKTTKVEPFWMA